MREVMPWEQGCSIRNISRFNELQGLHPDRNQPEQGSGTQVQTFSPGGYYQLYKLHAKG